jgi:hypothetical protein
MTEQVETNGSNGKPAKEDSALAKLLASVKGQKVNETDKKKASEAFKKAMGKRAELQKALDDFDAAADATAVAMVKCFGSKQVNVDGVRYAPTSRGERVYYKRLSDTPPDVVTL